MAAKRYTHPLTEYAETVRAAMAGDPLARVTLLRRELDGLEFWLQRTTRMLGPRVTDYDLARDKGSRYMQDGAAHVVNQLWQVVRRDEGPIHWLRRIDATARDWQLVLTFGECFGHDERGLACELQFRRAARAWRSSKPGARKSTMDAPDAGRPLRGRYVEAAAFMSSCTRT